MKFFSKRVVLVLIAAILVLGILPVQAFAHHHESDDARTNATVSPEGYLAYQAIVDQLNAEYGSEVSLLPLEEYEQNNLPLPGAASVADLAGFEENTRAFIEKILTENFIAECECVKAYLDPTQTYFEGRLPSFSNTTPWAVKMMAKVIIAEGYSIDVVKYIAEQNDAFSAAIHSYGYLPNEENMQSAEQSVLQEEPTGEMTRVVYPGKRYNISHAYGTPYIIGDLNNGNGFWQWINTPTIGWTVKGTVPTLVSVSVAAKSLIDSSRTWSVTYSGTLMYYYQATPQSQPVTVQTPYSVNIAFNAGSAAAYNGL